MSERLNVREPLLRWVSQTVGVDESVARGELLQLQRYEEAWTALLALPAGDPGAEALLKAIAGQLAKWASYAVPMSFAGIHAERLGLRQEARRLLGAGQQLVQINEAPL